MFQIVLTFAVLSFSLAHGQYGGFGGFGGNRPFHRPNPQSPLIYKLCTYSSATFSKCIHTVHVAQDNSINLPLECVQKDRRENCLNSIRDGSTTMVVLEGHDYIVARSAGLQPVVFERDSNDSLYIAVAHRNISLVDVYEASLDVDQTNDRAYHAARLFNLRRGHDICPSAFNLATGSSTIRFVDSAEYTPTEDEILICHDLSYANDIVDAPNCNFEAHLQNAVFVSRRATRNVIRNIKRIFDTILERFNIDSTPNGTGDGDHFNFFTTFGGIDDVIFNNNAIAFDLEPTYRNGVTETVFNNLHCDRDDQVHDPNQLE